MFRRLSNSLPKDPEFPMNLEELGWVNHYTLILSLGRRRLLQSDTPLMRRTRSDLSPTQTKSSTFS